MAVVDKSRGKLRYLATLGAGSDEGETVRLYQQGKDWIKSKEGQGDVFVAYVLRFNLKEFAVVADSGLMNAKNISLLESAGYKYIISARIRNESEEIKRRILSQ